MDDTLFLERDYVRSGFGVVAEVLQSSLGVDDFLPKAWAAFEEGTRNTVFDRALEECGVVPNPALLRSLVCAYRSHVPAIALLDDAVQCVRELQDHVRMAVVSDGPIQSQRAKATALGVRDWADPCLLTAELGEGFGKPSPAAFRMVEDAVGVRGDACVYVADNPAKDFDGPCRLGWRTIRVRRRGSLHELVPSGPLVEAEITDLSGLCSVLSGAPSRSEP